MRIADKEEVLPPRCPPTVTEEACALRKSSRELRADSQRIKLRSSEINIFADQLTVRVEALNTVLDKIAFPLVEPLPGRAD